MKEKQSTNHIFMVEPAEFYMNPQTLESNHYQIEDKDVNKDTILHEIAHALVGPSHGHNAIWRRKAREIGCSAMRCHNLTFTKARWIMTCPNGCFAVERYRRKSGLICSSCKHNVEFVPAQDDA